MFSDTDLAAYRARLRGTVIEPTDAGYDQARTVYNAMIDKRPRLIAHCADVADVIASVRFAREHGLLLAVRGGAHNGGGLGMCDDGLVIDLSGLRGIRIDPQSRTVRDCGSMRMPRRPDRSITSPSSHMPSPPPLCAPPRTASSKPCSRANRTDAITSATSAQCAISRGRLSIIALYTVRAWSYP